MIRKILYPLDFSPFAMRTLECIADWKNCGTKEIILLHSIKPSLSTAGLVETLREKAQEILEEKSQILKNAGLKTKIYVTIGEPAGEILRISEIEKVTLIVLETHREFQIIEKHLKEQVINESKIPLLLLKLPYIAIIDKIVNKDIFKTILYPTDFEEEPKTLVNFVKELKNAGAKTFHLLHVKEKSPLLTPEEEDTEEIAGLKRKLASLKKELEEVGILIDAKLLQGIPHAEILKYSEELEVSLIAMRSTSKPLKLEESIADKISGHVIARTNKPALIIKP